MGSLWGEFGVRIEGPRLQAAIFCYLASHYSTLCLSFPSCKLGVQTVTNLTGLSLGSVEQLEDGWSFTGTVLRLSLSLSPVVHGGTGLSAPSSPPPHRGSAPLQHPLAEAARGVLSLGFVPHH